MGALRDDDLRSLATLAEQAKEALGARDFDRARAILGAARESAPGAPETLGTLAHVAVVLGETEAAGAFLEAAIAACGPAPAPAAWYRVLGENLARRGRAEAAIAAFRAALSAQPDDADTWRWLARALRRVDDLPAAVDANRRAVALAPADWPARGDLAVTLVEARAFDEAAVLFDEALAQAGDVPALVVGRAKLDAQCGRRTRAIKALDACLAQHPQHVPALAELALALRDERRLDDAVTAFRRAAALMPGEAAFWCGLGRTLVEAGRAEEALAVAASYLQVRPGHAGALSVDVLARMALGDGAGAARLVDHERFVVRRSLPVPPGYVDLASFNAALASAALTHPTLHRAPLRHATAAGLHSGSLLIAPSAPVLGLQHAVRMAVDEYCRALPDWPEHPFVARRPSSSVLEMWCVVMERGGHQIPHIHPEAWLSGCYYPLLPAAVRAGNGPDGWLAFGEPDRAFPTQVEPAIVHTRPEEGLLVLFPSYFFHRTVPFDAPGTRVSFAFDVLPPG